LSIGFQERQIDSPYLQTLQRLAAETYGQYINGTDLNFPINFKKNPFAFVENGGTISIDAQGYFGNKKIEVILGLKNEKEISILNELLLPDNRGILEKILEFITTNWTIVSALTLCTSLFLFFIYRYYKNKPKLIIYGYLKETDSQKTEYSLTKPQVRIGRSEENDIILKNDSVSIFHAEITRKRDGKFSISDLSSTNGTIVNNVTINQSILRNADLIEIGEVRLYFYENDLKGE
jgi:hypothetical protein